MFTRIAFFLSISLSWAGVVLAQTVVNPAIAKVEFASLDQNSVMLTSYQAVVLPVAEDAATGIPTLTGPVVAKALAVPVGALYNLTFTQLGITTAALPVCQALAPATCPAYTVVLLAIGAAGTTARGVVSESDPFSLAALVPVLPASPSAVKIKGS